MKCGKSIAPTNTNPSIKHLAKLSHSTINRSNLGSSGLASTDENTVKYLYTVVKNELERLVPNELKNSTKTTFGTRYGLIPAESSMNQPGMWEFSFNNRDIRCASIFFSVVENYLLQNGWGMQNIVSGNTETRSYSIHYYTKLQ